MTKQEAIVNLSTIFNRGSSVDTETLNFDRKKHDDLLDILLHYIQNSSKLIGNPKIFKTQALNDHGVDLIVEFPNETKVGVQIKSHFDVTQKDFALKVKAQMAESQYHGLDKWYLLICSPLNDGTTDFTSKISHLISELSSYKTSYHIIYSPQQSHSILTKAVMSDNEYQSIKNQFFFEPVDWAQIIKDLNSDKKTPSYLTKIEVQKQTEVGTADLYLRYCGLGEEERESTIEYLKDLQVLLKKLSKQTREFLFATLLRAIKKDTMRQTILTSCQDLENYLNISSEIIKKEVVILDNLGIADIDDEQDDGEFYIAIRRTNPDYNILQDVKEFCEKQDKPLKEIIVNLDFSHFDE